MKKSVIWVLKINSRYLQSSGLKDMLSDINMAIQRSQFEQEYDKEDAMHTFQEAVRAIQLLKSHQLRLLNQDAARTDCNDCLKDNSVLLIQDWAMKFLPQQYRKSQGEWCAKKRFSWHITACGNQKKRARVRWRRKPLSTYSSWAL